jgi:GNAT superfamily N-acetyltransferase
VESIEAIERATLDAVPPQRLASWEGWLIGLDHGTVGRAHSAVPLVHATPPPDTLRTLEERYAAEGLPTVLRLPDVPAFDGLRRALHAAGYERRKPTLVQAAALEQALARTSAREDVTITATPGADWEQVFLGEGLAPQDGASRLAILRRGTHSLFARVQREGRTVAVGAACLSHGWCGIHGMRTLPAWRGRGFAAAIVGALLGAARERGFAQTFLQVEVANEGARALYSRLGYATAWSCAYWRR